MDTNQIWVTPDRRFLSTIQKYVGWLLDGAVRLLKDISKQLNNYEIQV